MANKVGHAKIDEWMRGAGGSRELSYRDAGLGEDFNSKNDRSGTGGVMFDDVARHYEEISADILMKERYGDHLAGEAIREQLGEVSNIMTKPSWEICFYRAKAEVFGLSDIKAQIDSELKAQHGIDIASPNDSTGKRMSDLTSAYCDLQGLNEEKFKRNFKKVVRVGLNVEGYSLPPDD